MQAGIKEAEAGPCNWELRLTSAGLAGVREQARRLARLSPRPTRVLCSPFPRCVATASLYAHALGLPCITVEPALCEVLDTKLGAKGQPAGQTPRWDAALLQREVLPGCESVKVVDEDGAAERVVRMGELVNEKGPGREQVNLRCVRLAKAVQGGLYRDTLLVSHGSPLRRLCDILVLGLKPGAKFAEMPMGGILRLDAPTGGNDPGVLWRHATRSAL